LSTEGQVTDADNLLHKKVFQIGLNEPEVTILRNDETGENASILFDFGVEIHGSIRLLTAFVDSSQQPVKMRITFGESVTEAMSAIGEKNATNDHAVRDMVVYVPALSDQEWGQTGFRFVRLELLTPMATVRLKSVLAVFIYRDIPYLGSFSCNDELINRIYDTAAYTCHLNMQNMIWDGIKRDRLVWIGDMYLEMLTIRAVFGRQAVLEDSLEFVKDQTPLPGWMNGLPSYSMWWILILWEWYWYTGDGQFLDKQKDYLCSLLRQLCYSVREDGTDNLPDYFLDWPTRNSVSAKSGVRCILRIALATGEKIMDYFHDESLKSLCRTKREYLDRQAEYHENAKQTIAFMALASIMDKEEASKHILSDGINGFSTFFGYYMLKVLSDAGYTAESLDLLKEYYGLMLKEGATTFWEDFHREWAKNSGSIIDLPKNGMTDIHGDYGAYCYSGFRHSLCHGWSSGPVPFLAEQILGIKIDAPGCRKITIQPNLGTLQWARGTYPTPLGMLTVSHKKEKDGAVSTTVDYPAGMDITIMKNYGN